SHPARLHFWGVGFGELLWSSKAGHSSLLAATDPAAAVRGPLLLVCEVTAMPLSGLLGERPSPVWARYLAGLGLLVLPLLAVSFLQALGEEPPTKRRHGMVVAVSPPGADVGRDVLLKGGNAV